MKTQRKNYNSPTFKESLPSMTLLPALNVKYQPVLHLYHQELPNPKPKKPTRRTYQAKIYFAGPLNNNKWVLLKRQKNTRLMAGK